MKIINFQIKCLIVSCLKSTQLKQKNKLILEKLSVEDIGWLTVKLHFISLTQFQKNVSKNNSKKIISFIQLQTIFKSIIKKFVHYIKNYFKEKSKLSQ